MAYFDGDTSPNDNQYFMSKQGICDLYSSLDFREDMAEVNLIAFQEAISKAYRNAVYQYNYNTTLSSNDRRQLNTVALKLGYVTVLSGDLNVNDCFPDKKRMLINSIKHLVESCEACFVDTQASTIPFVVSELHQLEEDLDDFILVFHMLDNRGIFERLADCIMGAFKSR